MKKSNISVGVIYDLEGSRSGDLVYLQWRECYALGGSKTIRGELFGVKETPPRDHLEAGLPEDNLELTVFNLYKTDKLLKQYGN